MYLIILNFIFKNIFLSKVYSLVNPDEHDRLLIDPAYRLERL
jgi:hypothetical protein